MGVDGLVIRHPCQRRRRTRSASGPTRAVINAGDGMHEHPTQALLDAYTLQRRLGSLEGRHVAIVGDLTHSRVFRSNVLLLTKLGARRHRRGAADADAGRVDAWPERRLRDDLRPRRGAARADAVMMLRVQRERMSRRLLPERP